VTYPLVTGETDMRRAVKNESIKIRLTDKERNTFFDAARKRGLTLSEFVRTTLSDASERLAAW
jgi:uncharacterized protein (DUF1778 family)